MSGHNGDRQKGGVKGDTGRAERLAAELRQNLQRRKQRARAVAARAHTPDTPEAGGGEDGIGAAARDKG